MRAGLAQDLVGQLELAVLALERLDALAIVRGRARPGVPSSEVFAMCSRSWPRSRQSPPTARRAHRGARTIRIARSRTSAENFGDFDSFVMAPLSQELKPPANPGRLTPSDWLIARLPARRQQTCDDRFFLSAPPTAFVFLIAKTLIGSPSRSIFLNKLSPTFTAFLVLTNRSPSAIWLVLLLQ